MDRILVLAALLGFAALQDRLSPDLLDYQPAARLQGTLQLGPASGFESLLDRLSERLKQYHPDLRGGRPEATSLSTPQAMTEGNSGLGLLPRRWTRSEVTDFRFRWGFRPLELVVGVDSMAVVVHPDNPIRELSMDELESIFASAGGSGGKPVRTWGELGLEGDWKRQPLVLHSLGKNTPDRTLFREKALKGADLEAGLKEDADAGALLDAVAEDPCAIGYVRGCRALGRCRAVPLRAAGGAAAVDPRPESILALSYPLSWRMYLDVRKEPGEALDPELAEFLKFVFSRDGQSVVAAEGFVPITGQTARQELLKLK